VKLVFLRLAAIRKEPRSTSALVKRHWKKMQQSASKNTLSTMAVLK
jgi:hypothetical protein